MPLGSQFLYPWIPPHQLLTVHLEESKRGKHLLDIGDAPWANHLQWLASAWLADGLLGWLDISLPTCYQIWALFWQSCPHKPLPHHLTLWFELPLQHLLHDLARTIRHLTPLAVFLVYKSLLGHIAVPWAEVFAPARAVIQWRFEHADEWLVVCLCLASNSGSKDVLMKLLTGKDNPKHFLLQLHITSLGACHSSQHIYYG